MGTSARFPGSGGGGGQKPQSAPIQPADLESARQELADIVDSASKATTVAGLKSAVKDLAGALDSIVSKLGGQ